MNDINKEKIVIKKYLKAGKCYLVTERDCQKKLKKYDNQ